LPEIQASRDFQAIMAIADCRDLREGPDSRVCLVPLEYPAPQDFPEHLAMRGKLVR
jgi:hypothetical protein